MIAAAITAVQMLTRVPTPPLAEAPDERTLAASSGFYPLVGAVLGLLGWGLFRAAEAVLPASLAAGLTLVFLTVATGALHEDGLADAADAFGSQWTVSDRLRVMKDSRIGTYGAAALVLAYGLRWQALAIAGGGPLLAAQVLSKWAIVGLAAAGEPVGEGSGGAFARVVGGRQFVAAGAAAALVLAPLFSVGLLSAALGVLTASLTAHAYFRSKLGGVTGDCLGAAAVVCETTVLLVYAGWFAR